ncbi:putative F-box protein isoform X2 [Capsicum chacoense]
MGELPEAFLVQILSLLEAQDAVKSSVLSKRWRYLWSSIYNFHFNDRNYNHVENFTELEDDDIVRLLSGCPAFETMKLSFCVGCHRLDMASSNLKSLNLHSHYHLPLAGYGSLEIFAPHLQHLHISGELLRLKCRLVNVSSLVTASLIFTISCIPDSWDEDDIKEDSCHDYHQVFRNLVLDYLQKLSSVTELIIGTWLAETLFMMNLEGVMLPEFRCKCLTLKLFVTEYNLYGIASLLQASPLLEEKNESKDPPQVFN